MLLILTDKFDTHVDVVQSKFTQAGMSVFRLDLDRQSLETTLITFDGECWKVSNDFGDLLLDKVEKIWLRRAFVEVSLEDNQINSVDFQIWRSEWNKTLTGMYQDLGNIPWLNPIKESFRAENKYFQMRVARTLGFDVPDTIVSNKKSELIGFVKRHGEVALKLMSQALYVNREGDVQGIFVNKLQLNDFEQFALTSENPIVLQKYIHKLFEVRYTVVGSTHHVCRIDSQSSQKASVDWRRYDIPRTPHSSIDAPDTIRSKVNQFMNILGLEFGALDFIVTEDGKWYFLEINPLGQWLWIEDLTGLPISNSVVNWFLSH